MLDPLFRQLMLLVLTIHWMVLLLFKSIRPTEPHACHTAQGGMGIAPFGLHDDWRLQH
jgi:hypothetical protein